LKENKSNKKSNRYAQDFNKELMNDEEPNPWKKRWEQENKSRINLQQQYNLLINIKNKESLRNKDQETIDDQDDEVEMKKKNNGLSLEKKSENQESPQKMAEKLNSNEKKMEINCKNSQEIKKNHLIEAKEYEKKISELTEDLKQKEYEILQLKPKISSLLDEKQISTEKKMFDLMQNLKKKEHEISQFNLMQSEIEKFSTEMKFKNQTLFSQNKNLSEELKIKENIINDLKKNAWGNMKNQKNFLQFMNQDDKKSESFFNDQIELLEPEINIYEDLFGKQKKEFDQKMKEANHQEINLKNLNKELNEKLKSSEENCEILQKKIEEENKKYKELIDTINLLAKQERSSMSLDQNLNEISEKAKKYCNFDRDFSGVIRLILEVNRSQKNLNEKNEALNKELNILMKIRKEKEIKSNMFFYPEKSIKNKNNSNIEEKDLIIYQDKCQKNYIINENFLKNTTMPSYQNKSIENEIVLINSNMQFDKDKKLIKDKQIHQENSEKNLFVINLDQQEIENNGKEILRQSEKNLHENEKYYAKFGGKEASVKVKNYSQINNEKKINNFIQLNDNFKVNQTLEFFPKEKNGSESFNNKFNFVEKQPDSLYTNMPNEIKFDQKILKIDRNQPLFSQKNLNNDNFCSRAPTEIKLDIFKKDELKNQLINAENTTNDTFFDSKVLENCHKNILSTQTTKEKKMDLFENNETKNQHKNATEIKFEFEKLKNSKTKNEFFPSKILNEKIKNDLINSNTTKFNDGTFKIFNAQNQSFEFSPKNSICKINLPEKKIDSSKFSKEDLYHDVFKEPFLTNENSTIQHFAINQQNFDFNNEKDKGNSTKKREETIDADQIKQEINFIKFEVKLKNENQFENGLFDSINHSQINAKNNMPLIYENNLFGTKTLPFHMNENSMKNSFSQNENQNKNFEFQSNLEEGKKTQRNFFVETNNQEKDEMFFVQYDEKQLKSEKMKQESSSLRFKEKICSEKQSESEIFGLKNQSQNNMPFNSEHYFLEIRTLPFQTEEISLKNTFSPKENQKKNLEYEKNLEEEKKTPQHIFFESNLENDKMFLVQERRLKSDFVCSIEQLNKKKTSQNDEPYSIQNKALQIRLSENQKKEPDFSYHKSFFENFETKKSERKYNSATTQQKKLRQESDYIIEDKKTLVEKHKDSEFFYDSYGNQIKKNHESGNNYLLPEKKDLAIIFPENNTLNETRDFSENGNNEEFAIKIQQQGKSTQIPLEIESILWMPQNQLEPDFIDSKQHLQKKVQVEHFSINLFERNLCFLQRNSSKKQNDSKLYDKINSQKTKKIIKKQKKFLKRDYLRNVRSKSLKSFKLDLNVFNEDSILICKKNDNVEKDLENNRDSKDLFTSKKNKFLVNYANFKENLRDKSEQKNCKSEQKTKKKLKKNLELNLSANFKTTRTLIKKKKSSLDLYELFNELLDSAKIFKFLAVEKKNLTSLTREKRLNLKDATDSLIYNIRKI